MPPVRVPFFEHPIERTEEEIAELRLLGLVLDDNPAPPKVPAGPAGDPDKKETGK